MSDPVHNVLTRKRRFRYQFTAKHHGRCKESDACWLKDVNREEEFSVFDLADFHDVFDDREWFYGVLPDTNGELRDLGTWLQQVAEFPTAHPPTPWHGYPIWSVNKLAPGNRRGERMRPAREVFVRMLEAGMITEQQQRRLWNGKHA